MNDLTVDLFAGPGGWDEALKLLGLGARAVGLEWDAAACQTRAAAGHPTIRTDVAAYPTEPFKGRIKGKISSPPCQAWSRAGKGLGLIDQPLVHQAVEDLARGRDTRAKLRAECRDERSLLAAEPMRWLCDLRPEWTAMEEVPDVLPLWRQYAEILRGWGYSAWCGILNAADYGVPQTRRRAILIASRVRSVTAPPPTHTQHPQGEDLFGESLPGWVSMAEALGWNSGVVVNTRGDRKTAGGNDFAADGPSWALTEKARSWVLRSRRDSPNWVEQHGERENRRGNRPAPTLTGEAHRWSWAMERPATTVWSTDRIAPPGHRDRSKAGLRSWELRSNSQANAAVRTLNKPASTLFFGHRCNEVVWTDGEEKRPITQAEAAILQSFRPDYPWQGSKTKQFEQIGNAVPPLLALHVLAAATGVPVPLFDLASAP